MIIIGTEDKTQLINLALEIMLEAQLILNRAIKEESIDFDFHAKKLYQIAHILEEGK